MGQWESYREKHLKRLEEAKASDEVDTPILPLLELINSNPDFVTTSSCSGRIVLLATSREENKKDSYFHRKWHRPVMVEEVLEGVESFEGSYLWFKMDPFILHVAARDLQLGFSLVKAAREAGVKISGIQSIKPWGVHLEIRNIENMAVPLVWEGKRIATNGYIKHITLIANEKMVKNQRRLEGLYERIKKLFNKHT